MSTPTRFSDGQYKNWLKCSQSLIIMKEALHDYIDNEVRNLHGDITLKVSRIPCASSTGNQCRSCSSKDIRLTGGRHGNWYINCKNSICDNWFHEILAVHDDPHNPTINWRNADISKWPTDCYHVAKIFMPKGQDKTTKMPDDLDAPAILSLLKYCSWFRKDLPSTQILSDLIDIRNKVLHSGDLRVPDSDKDNWIDLMIQLLSDLKIHGDAQSKLTMLKKEDIDVNFRETEIRVLQKMVSGLDSDITTVKGDMASLQSSQSDLSEKMEKVTDSTIETTRKVDTVDTNIEGMRKSLEELRIIYDTMASFFNKNPGILDNEIIETIRIIGMDVKDLQSNLARVETELKTRVSSLEKHHEETRNYQEETRKQVEETTKKQEETKKQVEEIERRVAAVEEQNKMMNDFLCRQKPQERKDQRLMASDSLKTEDKLDTHRKLECIPTKQAEKAKKLLVENRSIVIKGNPGEGKTTMALHLIDNEMFRDKRVVLNHPRQWETVDTDWVDIVVLEDVFGQYDFNPGRLQEWMVHLPAVQEHVDVGKLQVIITTRVNVLSKAYSRLGSLNLFSKALTLTLSSEQLTKSEKIGILNRELHRHKQNMKEDEKEVCIANFGGLIGFPQCCSLFAGDSKSFDKGPEFFKSPKKFFVANITELEDTRILSLAFLFCNGEILEENLSPETMPESSKQLLMKLAKYLSISKNAASITLLRDAYDNFLELYVVKSLVKKPHIWFSHSTVLEAVGHVLGDRCLEMVVKYGDSEYLYQRTHTADIKDGTSENVFIPVCMYELLAQRMIDDVVKRRLVSSVVKHSAVKNQDFLMKLKSDLHKSNVAVDFFKASVLSYSSSNLSEGRCGTFMQFILQSEKDVVSLVYSEFLEFLECAHNNISSCSQCVEKQNLLELALYYQHFEIGDKLITMKVCYTPVSLCNAARHGDLKRVQGIMKTLKKNQVFRPTDDKSKYALYRAYLSGNQSLIEFLLKEGIILGTRYVVYAVQHGDMNVLSMVVEHLRYHDKWNRVRSKYRVDSIMFPFQFYQSDKCPTALYKAYRNEKFDMADYLIKNGVKVKMWMLLGVLEYGSQQAAFRVIQDLKDTGTWDPHCDHASKALATACFNPKYDVCDLLVKDKVSLKMENLPAVTGGFKKPLESVKKAIQCLKETDNWDPKCDDASKALEAAVCEQKYDVYDLLVQEGISLKMKNLPRVMRFQISLEYVKKAIQCMKETDNWDPKCDDASEALEVAIHTKRYDVYDLLVQNLVSLKMKNLPGVIMWSAIPLGYIKKVIQHMKDTDNWDPKCADASEALQAAICKENYDAFELLIHEGVSLKMKNLPGVINGFNTSLESVKNAIQHLKDTNNWDPKCDDASEALEAAICKQWYDVYDLLVQEGISFKMKNLLNVIMGSAISLESVKNEIQRMKDTNNWDPKCDDASEALDAAICKERYDAYDLLVQEGVSLKMKNFHDVINDCISLEFVKNAIQHMKDTDNWDPKCNDASVALAAAICEQRYDVCDLLVQDGVSLKMKTLPGFLREFYIPLESVKEIIQHMKDNDIWDPKCDDASNALEAVQRRMLRSYDVEDLLIQEGVSLNKESS